MRNSLILLFIFLLSSRLLAGSFSDKVVHNVPQPVLRGENVRIELHVYDTQTYFRDARLFYRQQGDMDFKSSQLYSQGYLMYAEIPTDKLSSGLMEYYFAFETSTGAVLTLPEYAASTGPYQMEILPEAEPLPESQNTTEILILSPEDNETVSLDELLIAVSIPSENIDIDHSRTRMLIDGVNISSLLTNEGNLYLFTPKTIRTGMHNAEFKIFDTNGNLLGKTEWSFRVSGVSDNYTGFRSATNIFLDNRYQDVSENSRNLFRGGFNFQGTYEDFDFRLYGLASSVDAYDGQPENRLGAHLQYLLSPTSRVYLKGGNFSGHYDPLVYWDRRILGISGGMQFKYFELDITAGQTASAVEGERDEAGNILNYGQYKQSFFGLRPIFKFGSHVDWGLHLVNGKDDPNSIKYGANPREALIVGTTLDLNFDNRRTLFIASFNASIANNDAIGEVDFDTLAERYDLEGSERDLAESFVNFMESTGFLTLTQGLSPLPNMAMRFETRLNYFRHNLRITYKNIDPDYTTPGNPYLQKGIAGLFINDNIRLINNQVFLNLYFKSYKDNLSQDVAETSNTDIGATLSYFPFQNLPSITLMYGNQSRKNNVDTTSNSTESIYYAEDNSTRRIMLSSSYDFSAAGLENTATFSISNFVRDDALYETNQSDFTLYSLGIRNRFQFPLTTQLGFTSSSSIFGANINERTTDISKYYLGLDYLFRNVMMNSTLKPFLNITYQSIENNLGASVLDYSRTNYSTGLYLRNQRYGNLSLRYDQITYGDRDDIDWNDSILSTRYEINF